MAYEMEVSINQVINFYNKNHKVGDKQGIPKAYKYAAQKHAGMKRGTGEPYIYHPLRVARFLAEFGFASELIIAALLHDIVEDCNTSLEEIEKEFGSNVRDIVDAVTALSDKDFSGHKLTKAQKDMLSDARLQKKMNCKALYVKIADRYDNLNTLNGVQEEKRIPKAVHTREIIIPIAEMANAYRFVNILEDLCFRIEHPQTYEEIKNGYHRLCNSNKNACEESLKILANVFEPYHNNETNELDSIHRFIVNYICDPRSYISIFRQISRDAKNLKSDLIPLLTKENIALYDIHIVVSDLLNDDNSSNQLNDLFFKHFDKALAPKGFYFINYCFTTHRDARYFLIADEMDNLYRIFVRTETEYQRFLYGDIIDEDSNLSISNINEIDPRDTYNEQIKVFRKDGSEMYIDKGASVLDFAFHIHSEIGYHFAYAIVNESKEQRGAYTRLNEGDTVTIVSSNEITPDLNWFRYVRTIKATDYLLKYFSKPKNLEALLKKVSEDNSD